MNLLTMDTRSSVLNRIKNWYLGQSDAGPFRAFELMFTLAYISSAFNKLLSWWELLAHKGFHLDTATLASFGYKYTFGIPQLRAIPIIALCTLLGSIFVAIDKHRRIGLLVCFFTSLYFQGIHIPEQNLSNALFTIVFGFLCLMPGFQKSASGDHITVSNCNLRIFQSFLILIYLNHGISNVLEGWGGDFIKTQVMVECRTGIAAECLSVLPSAAWTFFQFARISFELCAPILFTIRSTRKCAIIFGITYNFVIALFLKGMVYPSFQICAFHALFLTSAEYRLIVQISLVQPLGSLHSWLANFAQCKTH